MTLHDTTVYLRQMLDFAKEAVAFSEGHTRADLDNNRMLNLALVHLLELIGEAANRVPREQQAQYPNLPWSQMIAMRHRLIHGYDVINLNIVWNVVTQDLPPLVEQLENILSTGAET